MAEAYPFSMVGLAYTQTIVTFNADHIAGTVPIILANDKRRAIKFGGTQEVITLAVTSNSPIGMKYAASFRDGESGNDCHTGAFYLATGQGLVVGDRIVVWEAT